MKYKITKVEPAKTTIYRGELYVKTIDALNPDCIPDGLLVTYEGELGKRMYPEQFLIISNDMYWVNIQVAKLSLELMGYNPCKPALKNAENTVANKLYKLARQYMIEL